MSQTNINRFGTPTGKVGTTAIAGSSAQYLRSDAGIPLDLTINPTWTGTHTFSGGAVHVGGSVDGATIGASTPASGKFTTLTASSTLNVTGASTLTNTTVTGQLGISGASGQIAINDQQNSAYTTVYRNNGTTSFYDSTVGTVLSMANGAVTITQPTLFNGTSVTIVPAGGFVASSPATQLYIGDTNCFFRNLYGGYATISSYGGINFVTGVGSFATVFSYSNTGVTFNLPLNVASTALNITNSAGTTRGVYYQTSSSTRWLCGVNSNAESTPVVLTTSAAQGAAGTTLSFTSTTGIGVGQFVYGTGIPAGATVASFVANTSVTLSVATSAAVGSGVSVTFATNTGSQFILQPYSDTGAALNPGLTIDRATGTATLSSIAMGSTGGTTGTTNKIALYGTSYGFGISSNSLDYVGGVAHSFYVGGTYIGQITSTGLIGMPIGASSPSTGKFTTLTVQMGANIGSGLSVSGSSLLTGTVTGNATGGGSTTSFLAKSSSAGYALFATGQATDSGQWDIIASGTTLVFRAVNDASTASNTWLTVTRSSGYTLGGVTVAPATTFNSQATFNAGLVTNTITGMNVPLSIGQGGSGVVLLRTSVSDAAYTAVSIDRSIVYSALTAARVVTLPAASTYNTGVTLLIVDESGAASVTNTITITRAGSDTINGATSAVINSAYGYVALQSNGASKWTVVDASTRITVYTVATLPSSGNVTGALAYASNCRVYNGAGTQEGSGAGTGGLVSWNGSAWKIAGTNVTAVA